LKVELPLAFGDPSGGNPKDDGSMLTGRWEIAVDGANYTTDVEVVFRKVSRVASNRWQG
jgi:hypothetical protein